MSILESYRLTRPNQWEQIWDVAYESDEFIPGRFQPIPPIEIPFLLQERVLIVATSSNSAKPHWTYAGKLIQQHRIPDLGNNPVDGHEITCRLNAVKLELMNDLTSDYRLLYVVPKWLKDISIGIWRYTGDVDSEILDQFSDVVRDVERNQTKIDNFRTYQKNQNDFQRNRLNTLNTRTRDIKSDTRDILREL